MLELTTRVEFLNSILDELKPYLMMHFEETAVAKEHMPLRPNYPIYFQLEAAGGLMLVTLRDEKEKIAGYYLGFIGPAMHSTTTLTNMQDIFYVVPHYRGHGGGELLFKRVEKESRRRGCNVWFGDTRDTPHANALFTKFGFQPSERKFMKILD